jgi:hypothetical protein
MEARLDMEEDRLTEAHMSGALSDAEFRTMIAQLDRQRMALYAQEEGGEL